jgi:hypothetical protein
MRLFHHRQAASTPLLPCHYRNTTTAIPLRVSTSGMPLSLYHYAFLLPVCHYRHTTTRLYFRYVTTAIPLRVCTSGMSLPPYHYAFLLPVCHYCRSTTRFYFRYVTTAVPLPLTCPFLPVFVIRILSISNAPQ